MEEPRIIRAEDAELHPLHGEGTIRRLIYPHNAGSQKLFIGIAEVEPGEAPHVFHRHGTERVGDVELRYADDFEEFYFIVEGEGAMQWMLEDGAMREAPVRAGDAVYMPIDAMEHRVFNTGRRRMRVLYGGTPPAEVRKL